MRCLVAHCGNSFSGNQRKYFIGWLVLSHSTRSNHIVPYYWVKESDLGRVATAGSEEELRGAPFPTPIERKSVSTGVGSPRILQY
jgi:hypothetical protein